MDGNQVRCSQCQELLPSSAYYRTRGNLAQPCKRCKCDDVRSRQLHRERKRKPKPKPLGQKVRGCSRPATRRDGSPWTMPQGVAQLHGSWQPGQKWRTCSCGVAYTYAGERCQLCEEAGVATWCGRSTHSTATSWAR